MLNLKNGAVQKVLLPRCVYISRIFSEKGNTWVEGEFKNKNGQVVYGVCLFTGATFNNDSLPSSFQKKPYPREFSPEEPSNDRFGKQKDTNSKGDVTFPLVRTKDFQADIKALSNNDFIKVSLEFRKNPRSSAQEIRRGNIPGNIEDFYICRYQEGAVLIVPDKNEEKDINGIYAYGFSVDENSETKQLRDEIDTMLKEANNLNKTHEQVYEDICGILRNYGYTIIKTEKTSRGHTDILAWSLQQNKPGLVITVYYGEANGRWFFNI